MNDLESYRCDHLFLLVGTNPLPDYVSARLLTKPHTKIHFIVSEDREGNSTGDLPFGGTHTIAERLRDQLQNKNEIPEANLLFVRSLTDPSDAHTIATQLCRYLDHDASIKPEESIGLNYTGGTKPMSVHSHELISRWCSEKEHRHKYVFSYLDPRQEALRFANGAKHKVSPEDCQIKLEDLFTLHGWEVKPKKGNQRSIERTPLAAEFCQKLVDYLHTHQALPEYRQWCDNVLRGTLKTDWWEQNWATLRASGRLSTLVQWADAQSDHQEQLKEMLIWMQSNGLKTKKSELETVVPHSALRIFANTLAELREIIGWPDNKDGWEKLAEFLDGGWPESYLLSQIQAIRKKCQIYCAAMNIVLQRETSNSASSFEFDVAAIRGYQLFAFSCTTTTDKSLSKSKLFEAFTRARQMGGDEARVALLTGYPETKRLLDEVNEEWLAPRHMIKVFGPADWLNTETFQDQLVEWFNH